MGPQDPGMSGRRRNAHPPDRSQVQDGYLRFLHVTCFGIVLSLARRHDVTVANERPQAVGVAQLRGSPARDQGQVLARGGAEGLRTPIRATALPFIVRVGPGGAIYLRLAI